MRTVAHYMYISRFPIWLNQIQATTASPFGNPFGTIKAAKIEFPKVESKLLFLRIPISRAQVPGQSIKHSQGVNYGGSFGGGGGAKKSKRLNGAGGVGDG